MVESLKQMRLTKYQHTTFFSFFICFHRYLEAFIRLFKAPGKKSIAGEIVLVTGAGHGIGRQIALDIAKLGTSVVVWDLNKENNESTAEEINKSGGKAFAYVCDVTDTAQITIVAAKIRKDVGEITILVNNAGIVNCGHFMDLDEEAVRRTFEVNILSHFKTNREFLPSMMTNNHGHILNVSSMAGIFGCPTLTDYCATKFGVVGLAEALTLELEGQGYDGIHISTLCPMITDTGMLKEYHNSLNPLLTPQEVSEAAVDGLLRNYELIMVPSRMYYVTKMVMMLPRKAQGFLNRFGVVKFTPQYKKQN